MQITLLTMKDKKMANEVNDRIINLLKSSGMTEVQLAEAIRKPASTVYRITRKEVKPSKPTLQLIATALNVNFLWLTYGKGEPTIQAKAQQTQSLSWQDATYKSQQDLIETLKEELKKAWAVANHFSEGKLSFNLPLSGTGDAMVYALLPQQSRLKVPGRGY